MLVVDGMEDYQVSQLKEKVAAVPGVRQVLWADDIFDNGVPREMLPEDVKSVFYSDSGTMMIISFEDPMAAEGTLKAIEQIKSVTGEQCFLGGMAAIVQDTKALADQETPLYVLVAVLLCMAVLWLGLESTVVPFIFLLGILFPILYNFGTNIFLGQISYITKALAAVLQLGVTMDFSIFLLHRFEEEKQRCPDKEEAMVKAISATLTSIAGSSVTTIAGFLALCTMRLTLGRDIGIVMAKGVLLGVICTVTSCPPSSSFSTGRSIGTPTRCSSTNWSGCPLLSASTTRAFWWLSWPSLSPLPSPRPTPISITPWMRPCPRTCPPLWAPTSSKTTST